MASIPVIMAWIIGISGALAIGALFLAIGLGTAVAIFRSLASDEG